MHSVWDQNKRSCTVRWTFQNKPCHCLPSFPGFIITPFYYQVTLYVQLDCILQLSRVRKMPTQFFCNILRSSIIREVTSQGTKKIMTGTDRKDFLSLSGLILKGYKYNQLLLDFITDSWILVFSWEASPCWEEDRKSNLPFQEFSCPSGCFPTNDKDHILNSSHLTSRKFYQELYVPTRHPAVW